MFESFNVWVYLPPVLPAVNVILKRLIICMTFTANGEGGEYTHLLTSDELAPHNHSVNNFVINSTGGNHISVGSGSGVVSYWTNGNAHTDMSKGGKSHNNVQPYKAVFYWRRVS